jgi:hypothetical protein
MVVVMVKCVVLFEVRIEFLNTLYLDELRLQMGILRAGKISKFFIADRRNYTGIDSTGTRVFGALGES